MANSTDMMEPQGHSAAMRWGLRLAFVVFGTAMGLVIASEPRVIETARMGVSFVTSHLSGDQSQRYRPGEAGTATVRALPVSQNVLTVDTSSDAETTRPRVSVMPESAVTIRRLAP